MKENNWEYGHLPESDRLTYIKDGDMRIYRMDTQNNARLKKAYQDAGLDTSKIDNWQSQLDTARAGAVANIPKYSNNSAYALALEDLENARKMAEDALKSVKNTSNAIDEDYVNRGIRLGNKEYAEQKQYLKKAFLDEIERLSKTYGMSVMKNSGKQFYGKYKKIADDLLG